MSYFVIILNKLYECLFLYTCTSVSIPAIMKITIHVSVEVCTVFLFVLGLTSLSTCIQDDACL